VHCVLFDDCGAVRKLVSDFLICFVVRNCLCKSQVVLKLVVCNWFCFELNFQPSLMCVLGLCFIVTGLGLGFVDEEQEFWTDYDEVWIVMRKQNAR